jgi:hypothetical protein
MNEELAKIFWTYGSKIQEDGQCGPGSTRKYTAKLRENLPDFLNKHNINSMVDAPCGYFGWMSTVKFHEGFKYIGADITEHLIINNKKVYPQNIFYRLDITDDHFPESDLMFVRDCLFHFNNQTKITFFKNFLNNNFKYLLTSNHPDCDSNKDVINFNGMHHEQKNWLLEPWGFPDPIDAIDDWIEGFAVRNMVLYSKEQVHSVMKQRGII